MDTEIELKFLVSPALIARLPALLTRHEIRKHDQKTLANTYFDTPNLRLSQLKAGLRTRRQHDKLEQTLKLAGSQVGGLHQRPEYNVDITEPLPNLSLFPAQVWPADFNLDQVQAELLPLFSTDFVRERWIIKLENTELELALDLGEVRTGEVKAQSLIEPIQELELELVSGEVSGLFTLAEQLLEYGGMRLSAVSKAQRGYRLAGLAPESKLQFLSLNANAEKSQLERLGQGLAHWQHHEQGVLEGLARLGTEHLGIEHLSTEQVDQNHLAAWLNELRVGVKLVEKVLTELNANAEELRLTAWLNELVWLDTQLQAKQAMDDLCYSARYGRLVLQLTHYLYAEGGH